jgi:NAD(P)-dependent dehydrogenase (short-subunit alcohol dehydrogenase family)
MRFEGRSVLVTGGGTGIGAAMAQKFAAEGAKVTVTGRREGPVKAVAAEIGGHYVAGDVSVPEDAARMVEGAVSAHGGLDVLVNNAGVARYASLEETTDDLFDWHVAINLRGPFLMTRAALPHLLEKRGSVINVSSTLAVRGLPRASAYGASKAAVHGLTLHWAAELSPQGVRVNCICPAVVETPIFDTMMPPEQVPKMLEELKSIHPVGRIGQPEDVAAAALYLASDDAAWVTGTILTVDGGVTSV